VPLNRRAALFLALLLTCAPCAEGRKRALLIGINDYTASRFPTHPKLDRDWPNLGGAVRDVRLLQELLVLLYGFEPRDIITLTDQDATRDAILRVVEEQLVRPAARDDILFFYFAGHGSQVTNSRADEPDKLDESIVPADSRAGARDIRDKELRPLFNRILDRGARLTVMLDNCHSGSGARGLATGARPRGVRPDRRDVRDAWNGGPRPEERGALVLTATRDDDIALETRGRDGALHGVFSLAWMEAMRDSAPGEAASETFLRAQARMRAGTPFQQPSMSGDTTARTRPFLGARVDRPGRRNVVGVERTRADGTVILQGGWASGLGVGAELRSIDDPSTRLRVTAIRGVGRSEAVLIAGTPVKGGALLEVVGWAASGRPLRVWTPRTAGELAPIAQRLAAEAKRRGIRWIDDPSESTPTHLLRSGPRGWELVGPDDITPVAIDKALTRIPGGASLFVQLPAPPALLDGLELDAAAGPEEADYILAGRYTGGQIEYAWMRPAMGGRDRGRSALPIRSDWLRGADSSTAASLAGVLHCLRRLHAWQHLESPPESRSPYRLVLRGEDERALVSDGVVVGGRTYAIALRAPSAGVDVKPRFFYVFIIDGHGRSYLAFPAGSVENRFPIGAASREIPLGRDGRFQVRPPYGVDTYFLLSTEEPLPNPWVLEWDGVRKRSPASPTPLEQLLMRTASGSRSPGITVPIGWSLERVFYESVPPRVKRQHEKRH
jgi:hypothetical protein